mgnify:CR=1
MKRKYRYAEHFLGEAGVMVAKDQTATVPYPDSEANRTWMMLTEREQDALLDTLEGVITLPFLGEYSEYLLNSGALEGESVILDERESKLLTFIFDQPLGGRDRRVLQIFLDAHAEIRKRRADFHRFIEPVSSDREAQ